VPVILGSLILSLTVGCGDTQPSEKAAGGSTGSADSSSVAVDGSSTVYRISQKAQIDFNKVDSNILVTVGNHGTGGGFERYFRNEVDVIDASRDAKQEETDKAKEMGLEWTRFLVGYDGITIVVNPRNEFVRTLSVEQLKKLYEPDSPVQTWKDLDASWPDKKIIVYSPDSASGTFEFFQEAIVGKNVKTQRKGVQVSPDDNQLVAGVAGDEGAIGYFGYGYYAINKERLRAVPIQNGPEAAAVMPTPETIMSKEYAPLSRPLYIFVKNSALRRPAVAKFVRHYLENIERLATAASFDAPNEADRQANDETLRKALASAGTPAS
jgi:phosphate transport system substrate-binding protein